jgi:hypothetical protein
MDGSANGIRTRVTAVRGRCPRPLDDSASELHVHWKTRRAERSVCYFRMVYEPEQAILSASPPLRLSASPPLRLSASPPLRLSSFLPLLHIPDSRHNSQPIAATGMGLATKYFPAMQYFVHIFFRTKNRIRVTILVRNYCLNSLPLASLLALLFFWACSTR